jgi:hypothetical protein
MSAQILEQFDWTMGGRQHATVRSMASGSGTVLSFGLKLLF